MLYRSLPREAILVKTISIETCFDGSIVSARFQLYRPYSVSEVLSRIHVLFPLILLSLTTLSILADINGLLALVLAQVY